MGGDRAPAMVLKGADIALQRHPSAQFLIFGNEGEIAPLLARLPVLAKAASVHHTTAVAADDAKPSHALPTGRPSRIRLAGDPVPDGHADALLPAAHTSALMAS